MVKAHRMLYNAKAGFMGRKSCQGVAVRFSISSLLTGTVIVALAAFGYLQQRRTNGANAEIEDLRVLIAAVKPQVSLAKMKIPIANQFLESSPCPSQLLQSMTIKFHRVQRKYGSFSKQPTDLATQTVPESNAIYHQRYQVRVFVPDHDRVQLRLAVFPCTDYRPRDAEPISEEKADAILEDNPFVNPTPVYIPLDGGEHTVLVEWFGDVQKIAVSIDDVIRYENQYERDSKLKYKYQCLGRGAREGLYQPDEGVEVIGIRMLCPGGGSASGDPMDHGWKCDLVRGSALGVESVNQ